MKANPGGQLSPAEIIGRDDLIRRLWRVLDRQSLILSAERRLGKTCVVRKMVAEAPPEKLPIYRDQSLSFDVVFDLLKSRIATEDSEMARRVLTLLQRDHYILQQADGRYRFCFPLIRRCWRLHRGLAP